MECELNCTSQQLDVQPLVERGLLECDPLLAMFVPNRSRHSQDDRVAAMVTMVTAMPDHRRCGNCAEVEITW